MSLEIFISTKQEKMKLITLVTKRTSKEAKCSRQYKRAQVIIKKRNGGQSRKTGGKDQLLARLTH